MYVKNILRHWTLCPAFIDALSDILNTTSDILTVMSYPFSIFRHKMSDIEVKLRTCPDVGRLFVFTADPVPFHYV